MRIFRNGKQATTSINPSYSRFASTPLHTSHTSNQTPTTWKGRFRHRGKGVGGKWAELVEEVGRENGVGRRAELPGKIAGEKKEKDKTERPRASHLDTSSRRPVLRPYHIWSGGRKGSRKMEIALEKPGCSGGRNHSVEKAAHRQGNPVRKIRQGKSSGKFVRGSRQGQFFRGKSSGEKKRSAPSR